MQEKLLFEKEIVTLAIYESQKMSHELVKEKEVTLIIVEETLHKQQKI